MAEWITRGSIWLAMIFWTAGILTTVPRSRSWWTCGLGAYLVHVAFAYAAFYEWSHRVAWEETARQTEELTGWSSGVGLVFNWILLGVLALDVWAQWARGQRVLGRTIDWIVLFFIFNGAVVFGTGPVRWFGGALLLGVGLSVLVRKSRGSSSTASSPPP